MTTEANTATFDALELDCGTTLTEVDCAYETWGQLNADRSNAILVTHAFSGDAHAGGEGGWWSNMIGPGKGFDTDRYFVICANVLGGCRGTTGPGSMNPATGCPWGMSFPVVTIGDMVRLQKKLIDHLGIARLLAVAGGSMGGMQALEWAVAYPDSVRATLPIATTARHSAQQIAFNEVGRQAIMADPDWNGGAYQRFNTRPLKGLAVARMAAHITYLSETALQTKFGRRLQDREHVSFGFGPDFQIESYLHHQGMTFVDRFDANSYLYITRAMDYFDLAADYGGSLAEAFRSAKTRFCIISFTSDWLFPTIENKRIAHALNAVAANVSFVEIESDHGHDAFLLDEPEMFATVRGFLNSAAMSRGVP
jgi:homoserine O-acetyltransferase